MIFIIILGCITMKDLHKLTAPDCVSPKITLDRITVKTGIVACKKIWAKFLMVLLSEQDCKL